MVFKDSLGNTEHWICLSAEVFLEHKGLAPAYASQPMMCHDSHNPGKWTNPGVWGHGTAPQTIWVPTLPEDTEDFTKDGRSRGSTAKIHLD